jgi:uncharacterized protein (UPF0371 family)
MEELGMSPTDRRVVGAAREAAEQAKRVQKGNKGIFCGAAIELPDGSIVTGKNSPLMHASSSLVFNAIKALAEIPDRLHLLSPAIIDSIAGLKKNILNSRSVSLDLEEALIALSISAATNPTAQLAMDKLKDLRGCEVHLTHIPRPGDEAGLRRLGVNLTSEPNFSTRDLCQA